MYKLNELWWVFHIWFVKWFAQKPLIKLSLIINGTYMKNSQRWYYLPFKSPMRSSWLNTISYKLTKYIHFR